MMESLEKPPLVKSRRLAALAWMVLYAAVGALLYANTLSAPFVFDDSHNILENRSIRSLHPVSEIFFPSQDIGISGRPLVNASFALNYAVSGLAPWSWHAVNTAIHVLAACFLFGLLRMMLAQGRAGEVFGSRRDALAGMCALLWLVHPVQTESVTYMTNRAECLMGLLLLATLFFSLKGWKAARQWPWHLAALICFWLGVGVKEVIVAAPVLAFIYQIAILRVSPGRALRGSPLLYAGFAIGAGALFWLVFAGGTRTAVGTSPYTRWEYLSTQPAVIFHYLLQAFAPTKLCFDWKWPVSGTAEILAYGSGILVLLGLTVYGLLRGSLAGFAGAFFFVILGPTSSVLPLVKTACDYRMYLPIAALICLVALSLYLLALRLAERSKQPRLVMGGFFGLLILWALALAPLTLQRNRVYESELLLWTDTAAKDPANERGRISLGKELLRAGRPREAIPEFLAALAIDPGNYYALSDLASAYLKLNMPDKALIYVRQALSVHPSVPDIHYTAGNILARMGDMEAAERHFRASVAIAPDFALGWMNLGNCRMMAGDPAGALAAYGKAAEFAPENADLRYNSAVALLRLGRADEAREQAEAALDLAPGHRKAAALLKGSD